jgi:glycosyltransferase 2 family protein
VMQDGHGKHHADPHGYDALPFFAPPLGMIALAGVLALVLPVSMALLLAGSLAAGYAAYGLVHTAIHAFRFRNTVLVRWAANHHIHHHHHERNFGVTTPLWDFVFGTRYVSAKVAAPSTRRSRSRRTRILIAVAVLATLAVPLFLGGREAVFQTLNLSWQGYAILLAVITVSWLARTAKLHLLLHRLGVWPSFGRTLAVSLAIDFAFISTPAGVGGYIASVYYARRSGASMSAATTVTAMDQFLDLAFFTLILPIAGLTLLQSELPSALAMLAFGSSALMIALALCALWMRKRLVGWLVGENAIVRRWPSLRHRQHVLKEVLENLGGDARLLVSGGVSGAVAIVALTAVQWITRYGVLWVALVLVGHRVSFALTLLLQSLILHAAMWTGVPSGGGGAEVGLSASLGAWVPATSMATALLLWRLVTFDLCLVVGVVAVLGLAQRRAK